MIQEQLFDTPQPVAGSAKIPPTGNPPTIATALGPCCKCSEPATLLSPGGSIYCQKHGYCGRRTCLKSVEKFVWHERLQIWCCSCVLKFERENTQLEGAS
jgi:hypothetical protein